MIHHKLKEDGAPASTLYWRVVIEGGQVKLQCSKDCDDWWYVASITKDGRMELAAGLPHGLGLVLVESSVIHTFKEGKK